MAPYLSCYPCWTSWCGPQQTNRLQQPGGVIARDTLEIGSLNIESSESHFSCTFHSSSPSNSSRPASSKASAPLALMICTPPPSDAPHPFSVNDLRRLSCVAVGMAERSAAARDRVRCHPGWSPPRLPTQEMSRNPRRRCARTLRPRLLDLALCICRSPAPASPQPATLPGLSWLERHV